MSNSPKFEDSWYKMGCKTGYHQQYDPVDVGRKKNPYWQSYVSDKMGITVINQITCLTRNKKVIKVLSPYMPQK